MCPTGTPTFAALRRQRRDLIIAKNDQRTSPYPHCCQRQRRKRYKRSPEPTTSPAAPIPRNQHRQICTCLPRAKGSLNRRFEWFSLVTFFLQKKKVTRAGARNAPSRARRRNTCSPPGRRNPPRAKGPLDRRSKRLSFPHFFLRRKKCGRRRPPPRQGETDSPPQRRNPPRAKGP